MPVREFVKSKEDVIHNNRGVYRVWFDPDSIRADYDEKGAEHGELDDDVEPPIEAAALDPALQQQQAGSSKAQDSQGAAETGPEEIQILELHSEQPLISHRGTMLRGSWARNIGTELIFAPHDAQHNLPALRHLPEGLDLLAASSARINFSPVELKPKWDRYQSIIRTAVEPDRYRENGGVYVHVHSDKYGVRRPQANFLEDLTALKRKRGEEDEVTITTMETTHNQLLENDPDEVAYRKRMERHRARNERVKMAREAEQQTQDNSIFGYRGNRHRWAEAEAGGILVAPKWDESAGAVPENEGADGDTRPADG